ERIADGKVEKFYQEAVLVEQPFVKDPEKTVGQVIVERAGKGALDLRFVRFKLGEGLGRNAEEAAWVSSPPPCGGRGGVRGVSPRLKQGRPGPKAACRGASGRRG